MARRYSQLKGSSLSDIRPYRRTQARATRIAAAFGSLMAALVQLIDERLAASGDVGGDEGMDEEEDVYEGSEDSSDADEEERKDKRRKRVAKRRRPTRLGFEVSTSYSDGSHSKSSCSFEFRRSDRHEHTSVFCSPAGRTWRRAPVRHRPANAGRQGAVAQAPARGTPPTYHPSAVHAAC